MQTIYSGRPIVYAGTLTGLRISSVDGTALIDNAGAVVPTFADGLHSIEIYDSSNRMLKGVLKAAGAGETLSAELFNTPDFSATGNWQNDGSWTISGGKANVATPGAYNTLFQDSLGINGALLKIGFDLTDITLMTTGFEISAGGEFSGYPLATIATHTVYVTCGSADSLRIGIRSRNNVTASIDNATAKQVLTPSTAGASIVSAKAGTTYNFTSKDPSFVFNASSYYCVIRLLR